MIQPIRTICCNKNIKTLAETKCQNSLDVRQLERVNVLCNLNSIFQALIFDRQLSRLPWNRPNCLPKAKLRIFISHINYSHNQLQFWNPITKSNSLNELYFSKHGFTKEKYPASYLSWWIKPIFKLNLDRNHLGFKSKWILRNLY